MRITDTHIYFYGNCIYSNWHYSPITDYSLASKPTFSSSEQLYMFWKAKFFQDNETAEKILNCLGPKDAKDLGRTVQNYNEEIWDCARYGVMYWAILCKFTQNPTLKTELISTNNKILVEASPTDLIWGVGLNSRDPLILDEKNWRGKNLLGKVLMEVRSCFLIENVKIL